MAKQDVRQKIIRKGLEILCREGIPVEDPSVDTIESFQSRFGKGKEVDLALVFLLGRIVDPATIEALTGLEQKTADREVKREIRRSLYKLAQKGQKALLSPVDNSGETKVEKPVFGLGPGLEGYLSSVDGAGNRMVWLAKPKVGSGIQMLQGILNDREGLVQVGESLLRRKELRQMMAEIKEKHGISMIPVPWDFADWVLYEAFDRGKALGRSGLEQFQFMRAHMNLAKPIPRPHPIYDHLQSEEVRSGTWREASKKVLEEPEFLSWVLDEDWIRPYVERVQEAQESRLVLNPMQKEERMGRLVHEITQELFGGEVGRCFAGRMEDMALYLLLTDRKERAQSALSVALALKDQDLAGLGVPFLHGLIRKSLAAYQTQEKAKKEEEEKASDSSLILKP